MARPSTPSVSTLSAGPHSIKVVYGGDNSNATSTGTDNFSVGQATASISVTPYNLPYDGNPHTAAASATGVGGVSLPGTDFNLTGTTHTLPGTYSSDAWSFSDPNYTSASGTLTDVISHGTATINFANLSQTYTGSGEFATVTTVPSGLATVITYSQNGNNVTTPTNAGSYTVGVTINDPNYAGVREQYFGYQ